MSGQDAQRKLIVSQYCMYPFSSRGKTLEENRSQKVKKIEDTGK